MPDTGLKHGSLFSGIGGFDLAAEWMGWENVFHCEWNKFGQQVLKYYWPNAISYDDICKTDFTIWRGRIDILTGGFPCQPYSLAGKRKGTEDSRHLWPEMLRAIRECKPTWIVGENVPGLINWSGGMVFEQVCADLEGEGYEVQPVVLPACGVNAPHRRDRVWIVAYRDEFDGDAKSVRTASECKIQRQAQSPNPIGIYRPPENPNSNGRRSNEREEETGIGQFGNIGAGDNERVRADNGEVVCDAKCDGLEGRIRSSESEGLESGCEENWDAANTNQKRFCGSEEIGKLGWNGFSVNNNRNNRIEWSNWPTVAPLCSRNDGISSELDGITFPKWRNESIKAGGNAIVPQIAKMIFNVIQKIENEKM